MMKTYHLVFFLALIFEVKSDCVWYDQCGDDPDFSDGKHGLNCVYKGSPSKILSYVMEQFMPQYACQIFI